MHFVVMFSDKTISDLQRQLTKGYCYLQMKMTLLGP